jgi:hypothetical protein
LPTVNHNQHSPTRPHPQKRLEGKYKTELCRSHLPRLRGQPTEKSGSRMRKHPLPPLQTHRGSRSSRKTLLLLSNTSWFIPKLFLYNLMGFIFDILIYVVCTLIALTPINFSCSPFC